MPAPGSPGLASFRWPDSQFAALPLQKHSMPDSGSPLNQAEEPHRDPPQVASAAMASAHDERLDDGAAWAPLRLPIFRAFWIASLISNLGTWIHEVGAGWLMTSLDPDPQMVSAVRIAMSGPMIFLAIPAGVLADRMDRRQLLIVTQLMMFSFASLLSLLTWQQVITSWSLLALTFAIGLGLVMHILTWQATIPVLVPSTQIARAIALGSISFNLARAAGPALGGVLIATAGVWVAFAVNAMSFAGVLVVLLLWKREKTESNRGLSYRAALKEGFVYILQEPTMRNVLVGVMLFMMPATALWSLLPLVARQQLAWGAEGYGLLVTSIGVGAVVAARLLHALHRRFLMDRTLAASMVCFAVGLFMLGHAEGDSWLHDTLALVACFVMGAAWMICLTTLNATAQMTLADHLRARGMGAYMTTMALAMAVGSLVWGQVAGQIGLGWTQWIAAAGLVMTAAVSFLFPVDFPVDRNPEESP